MIGGGRYMSVAGLDRRVSHRESDIERHFDR